MFDLKEKFSEFRIADNPAFPANDIGVAALFSTVCVEKLRYVAERKTWHWFSGKYWKQDNGSLNAMEICKNFVDAYCSYINLNCNNEEVQRFASKLSSRSRRIVLLADASSFNPLSIEELNKNKLLLNCQNGTFDFINMKFRNHIPNDYITKITRAKYDPDIKCERWEKFIYEVMYGDAETARYLQKVLGYSCTGDTSLEKLWILLGESTRNGKSTLTETISYLLGDYAKTAHASTISHRATDSSKASPEIARLSGTRFVNINEPDKDLVLNAATVKQLTGGDTLVARFLNENLFEFIPESKFFINTNHLPQIVDTTVFTSGRMVIIPFNRHFTEDERDTGLKDYFRQPENLSGILNWLIDGYRLYRNEGLEPSELIKASIKQFAAESDILSIFLDETIIRSEKERLSTAVLYRLYAVWAKARGNKPMRIQSFVGELRKRYEVFHDRKIGNVIVGATLVK